MTFFIISSAVKWFSHLTSDHEVEGSSACHMESKILIHSDVIRFFRQVTFMKTLKSN